MRTAKLAPDDVIPKQKPAESPEARLNQMIGYAVDLAEKQLREGTASSQTIAHFLKLGTKREELELEKLRHENEMLKAKTEAIQSTQRIEEMYAKAIQAMQRYSGNGNADEDI